MSSTDVASKTKSQSVALKLVMLKTCVMSKAIKNGEGDHETREHNVLHAPLCNSTASARAATIAIAGAPRTLISLMQSNASSQFDTSS